MFRFQVGNCPWKLGDKQSGYSEAALSGPKLSGS